MSSVDFNNGVMTIVMPATKNIRLKGMVALSTLFVLAMIIPIFALMNHGMQDSSFVTVILLGWFLISAIQVRALVWYVLGKEVVTVEKKMLTVSKKAALFVRPITYDLNSVEYIRAVDYSHPFYARYFFRRKILWLKGGSIWFNYGDEIVKIAEGLKEDEAKEILKTMKERGYLNNKHFS